MPTCKKRKAAGTGPTRKPLSSARTESTAQGPSRKLDPSKDFVASGYEKADKRALSGHRVWLMRSEYPATGDRHVKTYFNEAEIDHSEDEAIAEEREFLVPGKGVSQARMASLVSVAQAINDLEPDSEPESSPPAAEYSRPVSSPLREPDFLTRPAVPSVPKDLVAIAERRARFRAEGRARVLAMRPRDKPMAQAKREILRGVAEDRQASDRLWDQEVAPGTRRGKKRKTTC